VQAQSNFTLKRMELLHLPSRKYCQEKSMTFILWCILLVLCWPVALAALVLYPLIWLLLLPFRIVGIAVGGVLDLVRAVIMLPARVLRGGHRV
jgi:hypothetical protein